MPKFPKRLRHTALILIAVALGSCNQPSQKYAVTTDERLRLAEFNLKRAAAASSALVDRVERLERRVDELEAKLSE
jgi:hypothetical protein